MLIDDGSHTVLICDEFVMKLGLKRRKLHKPEHVLLAMTPDGEKKNIVLHEWVKLKLRDLGAFWTAQTVRAIVAPYLCAPVIAGLPFLTHNKIVIDHAARTIINKDTGFDLLSPPTPKLVVQAASPATRRQEKAKAVVTNRQRMAAKLKSVCQQWAKNIKFEQVRKVDIVGTIRARLETLAMEERLQQLADMIKRKHKAVFEPIPHVDELPTEMYFRIHLKDTSKRIATCTYSTLRKYREVWSMLLQEHLTAGRIRPSSSQHASPSFLIPKSDLTVLPHWVNDYCVLNANTVMDSHPLPWIDDILANCSQGKI